MDELLTHERRHGRHLTDGKPRSYCSVGVRAWGLTPGPKNHEPRVDPALIHGWVVPEQRAWVIAALYLTGHKQATFGAPEREATKKNIPRGAIANCDPVSHLKSGITIQGECEIALEVDEVAGVCSGGCTEKGMRVVATLPFANKKTANTAMLAAEEQHFFASMSPLFANQFKEKIKDAPGGFGVADNNYNDPKLFVRTEPAPTGAPTKETLLIGGTPFRQPTATYHHRGMLSVDSCEGHRAMFMSAKRPAAVIPTPRGVRWDGPGLSVSPPEKKWP